MARRRTPPRTEEFPIDAFLGGRIAPASQVARGMQQIERELEARFQTQKRSRDQNARALTRVRDAFGENEAMRKPLQASVKELQAIKKRYAAGKLAVPRAPKRDQRIFAGSYGITRVPPYNYPWTWTAKDNNGALAEASATVANGNERFSLDTSDDDSTHASAATALGIYVRPAVRNGYAHLTATPAINWGWGTWSDFASSHSDGWLGLYVGQYTLAGDQDAVPVDQQISLWSDDSWWNGAGWHAGSNSGYPLSAWFPVDSNHWYAMWVWSGGSVYAEGWGWFSGSGAISGMNLTVPAISVFIY